MTANLGMHGLDNRAGRWFAAHPDGSSPVHFGGAYDNAFVRPAHGLEPCDTAAAGTMAAILEDARADLRNGFVGLHMEPEHTPGTTADDLLAHAALAAEHQTIQPARLLERRCPGLRRKGRLGIGADRVSDISHTPTSVDRSTYEIVDVLRGSGRDPAVLAESAHRTASALEALGTAVAPQ